MIIARKVFSIIGMVFMGLALLGNAGDSEAFWLTMIVVILWLPLCILVLIKDKK